MAKSLTRRGGNPGSGAADTAAASGGGQSGVKEAVTDS